MMGTRVLIGSECADIVRDTDAMPSQYELVELVPSGGPRAWQAIYVPSVVFTYAASGMSTKASCACGD